MYVAKPYKLIGLGAMDVTKPYKFIGFVAMHFAKLINLYGLGPGMLPSLINF
jgi:hypothetical protein